MSSKRHIRRSKCERKVKYKSAKEARAKRNLLVALGYDRLEPYPCEHGPHWHLGHAPLRIALAKAFKTAMHKARKKIDERAAV